MNYGTAYGREPIVWRLGREALALIECDKIDEGECDKCSSPYDVTSRENRCGDCGNCGNCCTHKGESE